ncbi:MAG: glycosyltransferase family 4 protein [bacterium]|nr:glycosyltransferase family 4 protein [bacterium]
MNILQLIDEPWDSGITNYALTVSKALADRGHKVVVGGWPNKPPLTQAKKMGLQILPVNFTDVNVFNLKMAMTKEKIELVNAHGGQSHFWAYFSLRTTFSHIPIVRTRGDVRNPAANVANKHLYEKSNLIICAAEFIRTACIKSLGLPDYKFITVYQGLDTAVYKPQYADENMKNALKLDPNTSVIGIVGRLDPVKGHSTFVQAAKMVKDIYPKAKFLIVGKEENVKWKRLSETVYSLGLQDDISYLGRTEDVVRFMNTCDIGVVASVGSEAISRVVMEWMACGKPLVATKVGCIPELIKDMENGYLVDPGDHEAMAQRIYDLLVDKSMCKRMGDKAHRHIEEKFNLKQFAINTENAYQKVMEIK